MIAWRWLVGGVPCRNEALHISTMKKLLEYICWKLIEFTRLRLAADDCSFYVLLWTCNNFIQSNGRGRWQEITDRDSHWLIDERWQSSVQYLCCRTIFGRSFIFIRFHDRGDWLPQLSWLTSLFSISQVPKRSLFLSIHVVHASLGLYPDSAICGLIWFRIATETSRKPWKLSQKCVKRHLPRLVLAIEWHHCECCTPWPSFSRSNIVLSCMHLLQKEAQADDVPGRFASTGTAPAVELLLLINLADIYIYIYVYIYELLAGHNSLVIWNG